MRKFRPLSCNKESYLACLKHEVWGSKNKKFYSWKEDEHLIFIVDKSIVALAKVNGKYFVSENKIWNDDIYPHRIPIKILRVFDDTKTIQLSEFKDDFVKEWGKSWGLGLLSNRLIAGKTADKIINRLIRNY